MLNVIKVCFVIIGAIIGAGFISGQEILLFFNSFGVNGIYGIIITGILTGYIIYATFNILKFKNIEKYNIFIKHISNKNESKKSSIFNNIINIFLLITFYIMIAAISTYFKQEFNIPSIITCIISSIICYMAILSDISGIVKINAVLTPLLIIAIIVLGFKSIDSFNNIDFTELSIKPILTSNWLVSSIIYASYNSIILIPILPVLKKYLDSKAEIAKTAIYTAILLVALAFITYFLVYTLKSDISNIEMPVVFIASKFGIIYKYIFGIVIVTAIFASAISARICIYNKCIRYKKTI